MPNMRDLHHRVDNALEHYFKILKRLYPEELRLWDYPQVSYRSMGGTAGRAFGDSRIEFSTDFLVNSTDDFIARTVPHELCHLAIEHMHPRRGIGHGKPWKNLMIELGCDPKRCHSYDMSKLRDYEYRCEECGAVYHFSKRRHNACRRGSQYICNKNRPCRGILRYHAGPTTEPVDAMPIAADKPVAPRKTAETFTYECGCRTHTFSKRRHNNVQLRGRVYFCKSCKGEVKYTP